jgi:ubiquinone/menaquinone biosynthesis C-methylase UbiE
MDPEKIKSVVRKNFDESTRTYDEFEKTHALFWTLAQRLSRFCDIEEKMTVLDVGCGTGASTFYLSEIAHRVVGIDISEGMLSIAQKINLPNTEFIVGDAEALSEYLHETFDAILYNASIFLMPSPQKTLEEARGIMKKGGVCGASYLLGLFSSHTDIIEESRKLGLAEDGNFVSPQNIKDAFRDVFGSYEEEMVKIPLDMREAEEFYSIQAQSASLFPKRPYEERLLLVRNLFSHIREEYGETELDWNLLKAYC